MIATFDTIIFNPMFYSDVVVYLQSPSIIVATGYFLGKLFNIQADYTSLSSYQYLLCDVNASIIIPYIISLPTGNTNSTYSSNDNYTTVLHKTQFNQFYIINQPIYYKSIASITFNIGSLSIFSNLQYTSITVYSNESITFYSTSSITLYSLPSAYTSITLQSLIPTYTSITLYNYLSSTLDSYSFDPMYSYNLLTGNNSSTLYSSITIYSYSSDTIYSYSSITIYSSTTVYSITSSTIYGSTTIYSATLANGNSSLSPIILSYSGNVTSWFRTYSLTYNQFMLISFTNSQQLYIPLVIAENEYYDLVLSQDISAYDNGGNDSPVQLNPNNRTYCCKFLYLDKWKSYNGGSAETGTGFGLTWYDQFRIAAALGTAVVTIMNNSTYAKIVISNENHLGVNYSPAVHLSAQIWNDYTTSWTMLGTIVLPQPASGYIKIKRIR